MGHADFWVDDAAHLLHLGECAFPCDREIVASTRWKDYVLLLSADTDCLSLWDAEGLVRTTRVGVYPQGMAVHADTAFICGGADGLLHLLSLPSLHETVCIPVSGMPEKVCAHDGGTWILSLLPEPDVCTALLRINPETGEALEVTRFAGIPGALAADDRGLWVGVSELALRLSWGTHVPDLIVEGIGLPSLIDVQTKGIIITDALERRQIFLRT